MNVRQRKLTEKKLETGKLLINLPGDVEIVGGEDVARGKMVLAY